jgi:hypothetical protein
MAEGNRDWLTVALTLFTEQRTQLRHHELQRTAVTTFAMALTAGVATVGVNQGWAAHVLPITVLQMYLAGFALLMCEKLYERSRLHRERSVALFKQMSKATPPPDSAGEDLDALWASVDAKQHRDYGVLSKQGSLHWFWLLIHLGSTVFGFVMSAMIAYTTWGGRGLGFFLVGAAPLAALLVFFTTRANQKSTRGPAQVLGSSSVR